MYLYWLLLQLLSRESIVKLINVVLLQGIEILNDYKILKVNLVKNNIFFLSLNCVFKKKITKQSSKNFFKTIHVFSKRRLINKFLGGI